MAVECLRCGAKQRFRLPVAISVWLTAAKAFARQHSQCKPVSVDCQKVEVCQIKQQNDE